MRITYVNHRYWPFSGGSELWVQHIAEAMAARGNECRVVTTDAFDLEYFWDGRRRSIDAPRIDRHNGVEITRLPVRHFPGSSVGFRGVRRLMGEASRLPFVGRMEPPFDIVGSRQPWIPDLRKTMLEHDHVDIIHATNLGLEGLALQAERAARERRVPLVLTPFIHLGVQGERIARRYVTMPQQRRLLRAAQTVVVMTHAEKDFVVGLGVPDQRVSVVGAGVDPSSSSGGDGAAFRRRHGIDGHLVASIGALAADKGTYDVVASVAALRRQGLDVELALAGPSLGAFERWFGTIPDADRGGIHMLGYLDEREKRDLLAAMDVLALPSRTESFGIVYLEAWSNRKPVIAADTPATSELVRDGVTGLVVPFGSTVRLASAIAMLLRDRAFALELGEQGYNDVMARHRWSQVAERMVRVYDGVE
jgi:glycogen synthase